MREVFGQESWGPGTGGGTRKQKDSEYWILGLREGVEFVGERDE
jgi:hypothetical protein